MFDHYRSKQIKSGLNVDVGLPSMFVVCFLNQISLTNTILSFVPRLYGFQQQLKGLCHEDNQGTSSGSQVFSLLICLGAAKFEMLSVFTLIETICPRICSNHDRMVQKSFTPPCQEGISFVCLECCQDIVSNPGLIACVVGANRRRLINNFSSSPNGL